MGTIEVRRAETTAAKLVEAVVVVTDGELATVRTGRKWYLWTYEARGGASRSPKVQPMDPDWRKWVDGLKAGWRVLGRVLG